MIRKILALIVLMTGITIFIYPYTFREVNEAKYRMESKEYRDEVSHMTREELEDIVRETNEYNRVIAGKTGGVSDPFKEVITTETVTTETVEETAEVPAEQNQTEEDKKSTAEYFDFVGDDDVFAYIALPTIGEVLPIYLDATEKHLEMGASHIKGTSLPVGGESTHSVISAHRGWAKATLFRHIDKLKKGDRFYIYVFGNRLAYEVSGREIILPNNISALEVKPGEDRVTLLTCHPFPYMTHRLLVYGVRVHDDGETIQDGTFKTDVMNKITGADINSRINYKYLTQEEVDEIWEENRMIFKDQVPVTQDVYENIPQETSIVNFTDRYDIDTVKKINLGITIIGIILLIICLLLLIQEIIKLIGRIRNKIQKIKDKRRKKKTGNKNNEENLEDYSESDISQNDDYYENIEDSEEYSDYDEFSDQNHRDN